MSCGRLETCRNAAKNRTDSSHFFCQIGENFNSDLTTATWGSEARLETEMEHFSDRLSRKCRSEVDATAGDSRIIKRTNSPKVKLGLAVVEEVAVVFVTVGGVLLAGRRLEVVRFVAPLGVRVVGADGDTAVGASFGWYDSNCIFIFTFNREGD